ncbi:MAG TPA: ABC transporter permease [Methylophilaceae bacterium]|nr:ABC transporter permease [Methylophilaceae bacterium]
MILNPLRILAELQQRRMLLAQLVKRDVLLRYRGAMFGVAWIFLSPLLMLAIFAFVFGQIFQARWPQLNSGVPFWILLYSGLIAFNLFAETVSRSPTAVRSYPSYVKKIIFPVEILPVVPLGASLIHVGFNLLILAVVLLFMKSLHVSILLYPFLLLPLLFFSLGLAWFFAAWGVFIKDMTQIVPVFVQMLLFLSPVFYPVSALPLWLQPLYMYNPIGAVIEACRAAVLGGGIPWVPWAFAFVLSIVVFVLGQAFFHHSREEFADVL